MPIKQTLLDTIATTVCDFNMIERNDRILAAVSGGPDSVALVLSLLALKEKGHLKIGLAHLNHMLRGEESKRDEAFVAEFACKLDLPLHSERIDVSAHAKKYRLSIEEAGRNLRYDFFSRLSGHHGYKKVATGHTRDDNVELVLMNLLRGSGPKGLSGIPPTRNNCYIRPLIRVSKKQILSFLSRQKQAFVVDASNQDMAYLRNRVRNDLIPHLQSKYNPEIIGSLDRLSHILRQEDAFLDAQTNRHFHQCRVNTSDSSVIEFSKVLLSELHPAILNRVLRKAIKTVKKDLKRISLAHINAMIDFSLHHASGTSLDLPGQIRIYKKKNRIIIKKEDEPLRKIGRKEKQLQQLTKGKQGKES